MQCCPRVGFHRPGIHFLVTNVLATVIHWWKVVYMLSNKPAEESNKWLQFCFQQGKVFIAIWSFEKYIQPVLRTGDETVICQWWQLPVRDEQPILGRCPLRDTPFQRGRLEWAQPTKSTINKPSLAINKPFRMEALHRNPRFAGSSTIVGNSFARRLVRPKMAFFFIPGGTGQIRITEKTSTRQSQKCLNEVIFQMKLVVKIAISTFIWERIKTSHENSIQNPNLKGDPEIPPPKKERWWIENGDFSQYDESRRNDWKKQSSKIGFDGYSLKN